MQFIISHAFVGQYWDQVDRHAQLWARNSYDCAQLGSLPLCLLIENSDLTYPSHQPPLPFKADEIIRFGQRNCVWRQIDGVVVRIWSHYNDHLSLLLTCQCSSSDLEHLLRYRWSEIILRTTPPHESHAANRIIVSGREINLTKCFAPEIRINNADKLITLLPKSIKGKALVRYAKLIGPFDLVDEISQDKPIYELTQMIGVRSLRIVVKRHYLKADEQRTLKIAYNGRTSLIDRVISDKHVARIVVEASDNVTIQSACEYERA